VKQYDNTNTGLLAKNEKKAAEMHPDYTGSINVGGTEYWLSAWLKTGKDGGKLAGQKYFSLSVRPKDGLRAATPTKKPDPVEEKFVDDDVPF
jgi:hypothetical protein